MKKSWLENKTIIITGASSGIGEALAKLFLKNNNAYVIGIGRSEEKFKKIVDELPNKSRFEYMLMDVAIEDNWKVLAEKLQDRRVDVLINNAGMLPPFARFEKLIEMTDEDYLNKVMQTNFMSCVYSTKYLSGLIEKSETPAIINVASSARLCPLPGIALYSASKGAVKNFTESLALERKYYVGLVCPGFTKTAIFREQKHSSESKLISMISTDLNKMANKIYKGILKKKKRMVFGFDAKAMDKLYRHFPKSSLRMFNNILRGANIELFDDVFDNRRKKK